MLDKLIIITANDLPFGVFLLIRQIYKYFNIILY
jgi:hypothetical protein